MSLLHPFTNWLALCPVNLQAALQDIVQHLQIKPFWVEHPDYTTVELSSNVIERLQQLPPLLQEQFLSSQIQNFLYSVYYNGSVQSNLAKTTEPLALQSLQHLENSSFLGVDIEFYNQIHSSNCGEGYFDPGWQIVEEADQGHMIVTKNGLKLWINPKQHLHAKDQAVLQQQGISALINQLIAIRLPANRVQNGFYVAVSNLGLPGGGTQPLVRIYLNLTAAGAVSLVAAITRQLNDQLLPFSLKVLYNPADYRRHDAAVLYFNREHYSVVWKVLSKIYQQERSHFKPDIPLFTKWLAPGVGLAEEPLQKAFEQESFGMNRCQLVARGLLLAQQQGDESPENRLNAIQQSFRKARVDLRYPYLNPALDDIYNLLE